MGAVGWPYRDTSTEVAGLAVVDLVDHHNPGVRTSAGNISLRVQVALHMADVEAGRCWLGGMLDQEAVDCKKWTYKGYITVKLGF